jgi:hypothetical protein
MLKKAQTQGRLVRSSECSAGTVATAKADLVIKPSTKRNWRRLFRQAAIYAALFAAFVLGFISGERLNCYACANTAVKVNDSVPVLQFAQGCVFRGYELPS